MTREFVISITGPTQGSFSHIGLPALSISSVVRAQDFIFGELALSFTLPKIPRFSFAISDCTKLIFVLTATCWFIRQRPTGSGDLRLIVEMVNRLLHYKQQKLNLERQ
jgi:hypothetical protein